MLGTIWNIAIMERKWKLFSLHNNYIVLFDSHSVQKVLIWYRGIHLLNMLASTFLESHKIYTGQFQNCTDSYIGQNMHCRYQQNIWWVRKLFLSGYFITPHSPLNQASCRSIINDIMTISLHILLCVCTDINSYTDIINMYHRKNEDLQFQIEEEVINKDDLEVSIDFFVLSSIFYFSPWEKMDTPSSEVNLS